jgi:hypothetical protein
MAHVEARRIATQLDRSVTGPAWHGPSIREALRGVTPAVAAARPIPDAHSIWEILLHTAAWISIVRRRIEGRSPRITKRVNWPPVRGTSARDWRRDIAALERESARLQRTIRAQDDDRIPYLAAHGIVQHTTYHAGQMALLKKRSLRRAS